MVIIYIPNFFALNVPEECESFTIISIDSLFCLWKQTLPWRISRKLYLKSCKHTNARLPWRQTFGNWWILVSDK